MKFILMLFLSSLFLLGCVPDHPVDTHIVPGVGGGPGNPTSDKPTYAGKVPVYNGTWTGAGTMTFQGQKYEDLDLQLVISDLPGDLTMQFDISDTDTDYFTKKFSTLEIFNTNVIRDPKTKKVFGSIGATGFVTDASPKVYLEAKMNDKKVMRFHGFFLQNLDKVEFDGNLSNPKF